WAQLSGPPIGMHAVLQRNSGELVIVGTSGAILRATIDANGDTSSFMTETNPATANLRALARLGFTNELVVVGDEGTIVRSPGSGSWAFEGSPTTQALNAVWTSPGAAAYAVSATGEAIRRLPGATSNDLGIMPSDMGTGDLAIEPFDLAGADLTG